MKKVCDYLQQGDFKSADVKKLSNHGYFRAKLDDTNRLLFKPIRYAHKTHLLLLEVIKNHDYDKSRFLRGAEIQEYHINQQDEVAPLEQDTLRFLGTAGNKVHCLDRFIVFIGVIKQVKQKIEALNISNRYSIWPVLIHVNGVNQNVIDAGFFARIINFSDLLESP